MTFPDFFQLVVFELTRYISPEAVATEWLIVLGMVLLAATVGRRLRLVGLSRKFHAIANRKRLAIAICFAFPIVVRLSLLGIAPEPYPSIHDEFSHLLLGDTLAHGRLANAPHPLWQHFESVHILQQPAYASMYPPAQGAFLALGQVVFRHAWAGVLLSVGLFGGALCWMLQGWFPPSWALFGTMVTLCKFCLTGLWINSYLGGSPAAIGAALLLGAAARKRVPLLLGAGLVLLMNSRPFEGAFLGLLVLGYLFRQRALTWRFVLPASAVLAAGVLFAGYYNFRVTGHALQMPYVLNRATYGWPENLGFLPAKQLAPLRHPVMEAMRQHELSNRTIYTEPRLFLQNLNLKLFENWAFFLGPLLTIPLAFAKWRQRTWPLLFCVLALLALSVVQMVLYPYHLAVAVPALFGIVTLGVRTSYVATKRRNPAIARALLCGVLAALILIASLKEFSPELRLPLTYWETAREPHGAPRAEILRYLASRAGQHLVIVRYAPQHNPSQEWVYNAADIDGSKVVWAREMPDNRQLLEYFNARTKWLLRADEYPPRIVPYR